MAAFTPTVRTQVLQFLVGAFNAAPGKTFLNDFAAFVQSVPNGTDPVVALANELSGKPEFSSIHPKFQTGEEFAATFLANIGLAGNDIAKNYVVGQFNAGTSKGQIIVNALGALAGYTGTDAGLVAAKTALANKVDVSSYYSVDQQLASTQLAELRAVLSAVDATAASVNNAKAGILATANASKAAAATIQLTTNQDNLVGSLGDDLFVAKIINNANTLQSGDVINGGGGNNTLQADIGNSQAFAITPETAGVQTFKVRAQTNAVDGTQNNLSSNLVQIDAERMIGVTQFESNNSRADVVIEDVRILPTQITKDITIAMVETDPGDVDFGVYFDQLSLRSVSNTSSQLRVQLMDTRSNDAGTGPLLNNPYNGFTFKLNGNTITLQSQAIDDAQNYDALLAAIQAQLTARGVTAITASLGGNFVVTDTTTGRQQTGREIILTASSGTLTTDATTGFTAAGVVPSNSGLHTNISGVVATTTDKVTAKVILDDVGRGSTGGDLVIGGLSAGDTSISKGVERFEIEVRDNSKLQTINSTNNTLQEVVIANGKTSSTSFAFGTTETDKGALTVLGTDAGLRNSNQVGTNSLTAAQQTAGTTNVTKNNVLPGLTQNTPEGVVTQHNNFGFSDVRLIDASNMTGKFTFDAEITRASIAKYTNLVDTQANPAQDTLNGTTGTPSGTGAIANFVYTGGSNDDTMSIVLDSSVAASRSSIVSGREDFTLAANGGAGNDTITVTISPTNTSNNNNGLTNWQNNQDLNNNVTISGGAGNDTINKPGGGDATINGDDGNDTIYTDNVGTQAVSAAATAAAAAAAPVDALSGKAIWVFNTTDQLSSTTAAGNGSTYEGARDIGNLRSDSNDVYNMFKVGVTIQFRGLTASLASPLANTNTYRMTDLELNQAMKKIINEDAVLSKLLVAKDGPGNVLVVESLIDGQFSANDLNVRLTLPTTGALTTSEVSAAAAAYGLTGANATEANVLAAMNTAFNTFGTNVAAGTSNSADGNAAGTVQTSGAPLSGGSNNDYAAAFAVGYEGTNQIDIRGANSTEATDNTVTGGAGNDVIVLSTDVFQSTSQATSVAASSNEVLKFAAAFGNDTVVNFVAAGGTQVTNNSGNNTTNTSAVAASTVNAGVDYLDFSAIGGFTTAAGFFQNLTNPAVGTALNPTSNNSIIIENYTNSTSAPTLAQIQAKYAATTNTAAWQHVYVSVVGNTGSVYTITDPAGASAATAVLQGTITLATERASNTTATANSIWSALNQLNFVLPSATSDGASQQSQIYTGTSANDVIFGSQANDTIDGLAGADSIQGRDGFDSIFGNDGNDTIDGGNGNDTIDGGIGNDSIVGGAGDDTLRDGADTDVVVGGDGNDNITLGADGVIDVTAGLAGNDIITLVTGSGVDEVHFRSIDGTDVVTGFDAGTNATSVDFIAFLDTDAATDNTVGNVNFAATDVAAGNGAQGTRFAAGSTDVISGAVAAFTGAAAGTANKLFIVNLGAGQTITNVVNANVTNSYVVVNEVDVDTATAGNQAGVSIYYDADWANATGLVRIAGLVGVDIANLDATDFGVYNPTVN